MSELTVDEDGVAVVGVVVGGAVMLCLRAGGCESVLVDPVAVADCCCC